MTEIFVAPNGNDNSSGSATAPLGTIQRALEVAKTRPANDRVIRLRPVEYRQSAAIEVGTAMSGVSIIADGNAFICGDTPVKGLWSRVGEENGGVTYAVAVGGVVTSAWLDGNRLAVSRLPLGDGVGAGWYTLASNSSASVARCKDIKSDAAGKTSWAIVWPHGWWQERLACSRVGAGAVTLASPCRFPLAQPGEPGLMRICNVRGGLVPWTWYHDAAAGVLYVNLPASEPRSALQRVTTSGLVTLLNVEGSDVQLSGLTFRRTAARKETGDYTSHAVRVLQAPGASLNECTWDQIGAGGVLLWEKSRNAIATKCRFRSVGESAVSIIGRPGVEPDGKYAASGVLVSACVIEDCGWSIGSAAAVHVASADDVRIEDCMIRNAAHCGIRVNGNGNGGSADASTATGRVIIFGNTIDGFNRTCTDGGGVYFWSGSRGGHVVRDNAILHGGGPRPWDDKVQADVGVYFDDWANGAIVENNAIQDVAWGFNFHACHDVTIRQNSVSGVRRWWWNEQWESYGRNSGNRIENNRFTGAPSCIVHRLWGLQNVTPPPIVAVGNTFNAPTPPPGPSPPTPPPSPPVTDALRAAIAAARVKIAEAEAILKGAIG